MFLGNAGVLGPTALGPTACGKAVRCSCTAAWEAGSYSGYSSVSPPSAAPGLGEPSPAQYLQSTHSDEEMQAALLLPSISVDITR